MPKSAKIIIFISALLVFTGYLISNLVLPAVIRSQIKQRIESDCESCKFTSENINLKYFPTRIIATQVHFETGSPKNTFIQADIPQTIIHFSLKSLKHHLIKITSIVVDKPNVVVAEGDEKAKKSTDEKTIDDWKLEIDKVNLNDASFIYQREQHGKTGKLHISKLNAEISNETSLTAGNDLSFFTVKPDTSSIIFPAVTCCQFPDRTYSNTFLKSGCRISNRFVCVNEPIIIFFIFFQ